MLLRYRHSARLTDLYIGVALFAFAIPEKLQFGLLFAPFALLIWWHLPKKHKLLTTAVCCLTLVCALLPNLYYSDLKAWTAYSGERYYAGSIPHFAPESVIFRMLFRGCMSR